MPSLRSKASRRRTLIIAWGGCGIGVCVVVALLAVRAAMGGTSGPLFGAGAAILAVVYLALLLELAIRRRSLAAGAAATWGALVAFSGFSILTAPPDIPNDPGERLAELNIIIGGGGALVGIGMLLAYHGAVALGGSQSRPLPGGWLWAAVMLPVAPLLVAGQSLVSNPDSAPWLFPFVALGVVLLPSIAVTGGAASTYRRLHPDAWPLSTREWIGALAFGAVAATTIAGTINTIAIFGLGEWLLRLEDAPHVLALDGAAARAHDILPVVVIAPFNEEFWKGSIVAVFAYRRGGAARAFLWGMLAGAGFSILETFVNSFSSVSPDVLDDPDLRSQWWIFGVARAGTAVMHATATGFAALAVYGVFRRRWLFLAAYPLAVSLHAGWNGMVYVIVGDQFEAQSGSDSLLLDVAGVAGMFAIITICLLLLVIVAGRLRDESPAPVYAALGMRPAWWARRVEPPPPRWDPLPVDTPPAVAPRWLPGTDGD